MSARRCSTSARNCSKTMRIYSNSKKNTTMSARSCSNTMINYFMNKKTFVETVEVLWDSQHHLTHGGMSCTKFPRFCTDDEALSVHPCRDVWTYTLEPNANSIFFGRNNVLEVLSVWLHVLHEWNPPDSQTPSVLLSVRGAPTWVTGNLQPFIHVMFIQKHEDLSTSTFFFVFKCVFDLAGIRQKDYGFHTSLVCV